MALSFSTGCGGDATSFYILTTDSERIRVAQMDDGCIVGRDGYARMSYVLNSVMPELKQWVTENFVAK